MATGAFFFDRCPPDERFADALCANLADEIARGRTRDEAISWASERTIDAWFPYARNEQRRAFRDPRAKPIDFDPTAHDDKAAAAAARRFRAEGISSLLRANVGIEDSSRRDELLAHLRKEWDSGTAEVVRATAELLGYDAGPIVVVDASPENARRVAENAIREAERRPRREVPVGDELWLGRLGER